MERADLPTKRSSIFSRRPRAACLSRNCVAWAVSAMRPSTSGTKFGGMQRGEATQLREIESVNARIKKLLAEAHSKR